jgi:hypothetical protein
MLGSKPAANRVAGPAFRQGPGAMRWREVRILADSAQRGILLVLSLPTLPVQVRLKGRLP